MEFTGPLDPQGDAQIASLPEADPTETKIHAVDAALLHPKYKIPASCFAYVGDANKPSTWKLPYLHADGTPDHSRLPKAIQAVLSNYRDATVSTVPEKAVSDVLVRH